MTLLFSDSSLPAETVHCALLPFNPYFRPFNAYYLTKSYWHAILSRVHQPPSPPIARFLPYPAPFPLPQTCPERSRKIPSIQLLCPQSLTDSSTQRQLPISFAINSLRTLFLATEGVPLLASPTSNPQNTTSTFSISCALFCSFLHAQRIQLLSFQSLPHSLPKTPGVGGTPSPNSTFYLLLSTFPRSLPMGHGSLATDHFLSGSTVAFSPHSTPRPLRVAAPARTIERESGAKSASHVRSLANWSRKNNLWVR